MPSAAIESCRSRMAKRRTNTIGGPCWPPTESPKDGPADLHHRFFEFFRGPESDLLTGFDVDGLASRRIAPFTGCALAHLQDPKPAYANAVALLEMLGHQTDQVAEHGFRLLFRHLVVLRQIGGKMFQRNCRCRFLGWRCHG